MGRLALVTSQKCIENDFDMVPLLAACADQDVVVEVRDWDDWTIDWSSYDAVVLRSPWDYSERLSEFVRWCEHVSLVSKLHNPLSAVQWSLDKHYLGDLAARGVAVVPTNYIEFDADPAFALAAFLDGRTQPSDFVVKPTIGCYSADVRRFTAQQADHAIAHIRQLHTKGKAVLLQPYLPSIDSMGETNLIFFDGSYSHAIRKDALLSADGTVHPPTFDFRTPRDADADERAVAQSAIAAAQALLSLSNPLLYARVDLIRDENGDPRLLELEIAEPSLSLPFSPTGAERFAKALAHVATVETGA